MRAILAFLGLAAVPLGASVLDAQPAGAVCSVFDKHPCAPTVCSVFQRRPCVPEIGYPLSQDLRLTIESAPRTEQLPLADQADGSDPSDRKLGTLQEMFEALRACWFPPEEDEARSGTQISVRFAFKRSGEIIATPRVTYASRGTTREARDIYLRAITAALERCAPLNFTDGLAGAVAGRPIAIRFVENRILQGKDKAND